MLKRQHRTKAKIVRYKPSCIGFPYLPLKIPQCHNESQSFFVQVSTVYNIAYLLTFSNKYAKTIQWMWIALYNNYTFEK